MSPSPTVQVRFFQHTWVLLVAVLIVVTGYLLTSRQAGGVGFPLDDAWIHQTYARSLGQRGEWTYNADQPSAGSTAPLWSALLAGGYGMGIDPRAWAYLLGTLSLWGAGIAAQKLGEVLLQLPAGRIPWVGLFVVGEFHVGWAALSGMETVLYAALILMLLWASACAHGRIWVWVGAGIGLSVWVRPDAVTLMGPAMLLAWVSTQDMLTRRRALGWLALGAALPFGAYVLFNWVVQGAPWPNTFYAKQAEYAVLREQPLWVRYARQLTLPLIGAGALLLPGFLWELWHAVRARRWVSLAAAAWFLGFAFIYALRLPVTYQYGRYLIPAMPVYFVLGLVGVLRIGQRLGNTQMLRRVLRRAWGLSLGAALLAFAIQGSQIYARDVRLIETEMVASAHWVALNTPPDALVAAHDIGALGYFGERKLLDLAGLISPEVIPFMRDEARLAHWLDTQNAQYLVTFPDWYETLQTGKEVLFVSGGTATQTPGAQNMTVYRWK